jgi:uncharacterized protein YyaL (SSP411 family)/cytochrome c biogenesis protein CcdA
MIRHTIIHTLTRFPGRLLVTMFLMAMLAAGYAFAEEKYSYEKAEELTQLINWREYGPSMFEEARTSHKPIFMLLTAPSWCYWCQVYESEENLFHPDVIAVLNEAFIPVYVDADRRQDLTRQYLERGWPTTVIMAPDGTRLLGYSGSRPAEFILPMLRQAVDYVQGSTYELPTADYDYTETAFVRPTEASLKKLLENYSEFILKGYDRTFGGFGSGMKYPQGMTLDYSLDYFEKTGDRRYHDLVRSTLENQYTKREELETNYNLFDPVDGGFHRYGTKRDWTPPHFEKMLYDNARLLKAYYHLALVEPENQLAEEVFIHTDRFIQENWYDTDLGGFFSNSDVAGEYEYYGQDPRPEARPRVEETKYTDWNSEAITTYLYLYSKSGESRYKEMSASSLDFFMDNMISDMGAYHYQTPEGNKGGRGNIFDNAGLLLALIEGYEVLGDPLYLDGAAKLAEYSLSNLYDWNSGGFFERNSPDRELFAKGEHINLGKPSRENGVMGYAMLKLYGATGDSRYLAAGIRTLGINLDRVGVFDRGYHYALMAQLVLEKNLLNDFDRYQVQISVAEAGGKRDFWLNDLLKKGSHPQDGTGFVMEKSGSPGFEASMAILLLVALLAGLLSFASPCTLPILPAFIAYSLRDTGKNVGLMTLAFFLGLSCIFTLLGLSASIAGKFLQSHLPLFTQVTGMLIIGFGFYTLLSGGFRGLGLQTRGPVTYLGSFVFGGALGLSWTPCIGPILAAVLLIASTTGSAAKGAFLLLAYAWGLAMPLIAAGTWLDRLDRTGRFWTFIRGRELTLFGRKIHSSSLVSAIIFITLGTFILTGSLYTLNRFLSTTFLQDWLFALEEGLMRLVR